MNNLVISIIAVALATILAGVGVFFGGDIFKEQQVDGAVAQYLNESEQVRSAVTLYKSDGNTIDSNFEVHFLVDDDYLQQIPEGWGKIPGSIGVEIPETIPGFSEQVCFTANEKMGYTFSSTDDMVQPYSKDEQFGVPYCDKSDLDSNVPCCILESSVSK